jgi:hypothetical protein
LVGAKDLGTPQPGEHRVRWEFETPVSPGQYTVRVTAGGGGQASATVVIVG